jgi:hypothetical protein
MSLESIYIARVSTRSTKHGESTVPEEADILLLNLPDEDVRPRNEPSPVLVSAVKLVGMTYCRVVACVREQAEDRVIAAVRVYSPLSTEGG